MLMCIVIDVGFVTSRNVFLVTLYGPCLPELNTMDGWMKLVDMRCPPILPNPNSPNPYMLGLGIGLGSGFDYFRQYNVIRRNGAEPDMITEMVTYLTFSILSMLVVYSVPKAGRLSPQLACRQPPR